MFTDLHCVLDLIVHINRGVIMWCTETKVKFIEICILNHIFGKPLQVISKIKIKKLANNKEISSTLAEKKIHNLKPQFHQEQKEPTDYIINGYPRESGLNMSYINYFCQNNFGFYFDTSYWLKLSNYRHKHQSHHTPITWHINMEWWHLWILYILHSLCLSNTS